jgi:predicted PolB exonuclease-like 3'-5' exonuclease
MAEFVIVWDLETVPDIEASARMLGLEDATEDLVRAQLGPGFAKRPLHKIACIGAIVARRTSFGWNVEAMGAPHIGERDEAELIQAFVEKIRELRPKLVTFNGNSFDLPVLRYRAMVHRIAAPGLQLRPYFKRYTEDALDLCDVLASFDAHARIKLDEICRILGLDGKPYGIDGAQVDAMVRAGQIVDVANYCESDVVNTYRLWLIYERFRGNLEADQLARSEEQLKTYIRDKRRANPYLDHAGPAAGVTLPLPFFDPPAIFEPGEPHEN